MHVSCNVCGQILPTLPGKAYLQLHITLSNDDHFVQCLTPMLAQCGVLQCPPSNDGWIDYRACVKVRCLDGLCHIVSSWWARRHLSVQLPGRRVIRMFSLLHSWALLTGCAGIHLVYCIPTRRPMCARVSCLPFLLLTSSVLWLRHGGGLTTKAATIRSTNRSPAAPRCKLSNSARP
jgi:hypothetical protein